MYELICAKMSIFPPKMAQETIQYGQEMCQDEQETCHRVQESSLGYKLYVIVALRAPKYASLIVIRIILQFHQFRFPGFSGNFNNFLYTFPGRFFWFKGKFGSPLCQFPENSCPFVNWSTMLEAGTPRVHLRKGHSQEKNVLLYWIYPYIVSADVWIWQVYFDWSPPPQPSV